MIKLAEAKLILLGALPADRKMRGLPAALVILLLTEYVNTAEYLRTGRLIAWPAVGTLAQHLGANRASIQRAFRVACEAGYLVRRASGVGAGNRAIYELLWHEKGCAHAARLPLMTRRRRFLRNLLLRERETR
jgi:hypothetical protein